MKDLPRNWMICVTSLTTLAAVLLVALSIAMIVRAEASTLAALAASLGAILTLLGALLRTWRGADPS